MERRFTDGWRGRIGLVATAPGNAAEADFNQYRPEGVAVMTTRIPLSASTPEGIREMNGYLEQAVRLLAENCCCDVILCSSTAGSFVDGRAADEARARRLSQETGCPVITSAQCMLWALEALGVKRVTLITPSSGMLNRAEQAYLEQAGVTVAAQGGFLLERPRDILCVPSEQVERMVMDTDVDQAQGVLISCSGLHVLPLIDRLERALGKPVLASNQFGLWGCLRQMKLTPCPAGPGRLFQY